MRVLLLLLASTAAADPRADVHAAAGAEAGLIQGKPVPDGVAEVGIGLDYVPHRWGFGVTIERVARGTAALPIASEHKLALLVRFTDPKRRLRGAFGAGLRRIIVSGDVDRPGSTLNGIEVFRISIDREITRSDELALHVYFAWSFGIYMGDVYNERMGDVPHTTRHETTLSNSYVVGMKTSVDL